MLSIRKASLVKKNCSHLETTVTLTAGLERVACKACGNVSIQFADNGVTEEPADVEVIPEDDLRRRFRCRIGAHPVEGEDRDDGTPNRPPFSLRTAL